MLLAFFVAAVAVMSQSHSVTMEEFFAMRVKITNFLIFAIFVFVWHLAFSGFGLYNSRRLGDRRSEVIDVLKATSLGAIIVSLPARWHSGSRWLHRVSSSYSGW